MKVVSRSIVTEIDSLLVIVTEVVTIFVDMGLVLSSGAEISALFSTMRFADTTAVFTKSSSASTSGHRYT
jgi:hypothetical protein